MARYNMGLIDFIFGDDGQLEDMIIIDTLEGNDEV